jgi:hypothetical protein
MSEPFGIFMVARMAWGPVRPKGIGGSFPGGENCRSVNLPILLHLHQNQLMCPHVCRAVSFAQVLDKVTGLFACQSKSAQAQ